MIASDLDRTIRHRVYSALAAATPVPSAVQLAESVGVGVDTARSSLARLHDMRSRWLSLPHLSAVVCRPPNVWVGAAGGFTMAKFTPIPWDLMAKRIRLPAPSSRRAW
jgi:hypothetical protein